MKIILQHGINKKYLNPSNVDAVGRVRTNTFTLVLTILGALPYHNQCGNANAVLDAPQVSKQGCNHKVLMTANRLWELELVSGIRA